MLTLKRRVGESIVIDDTIIVTLIKTSLSAKNKTPFDLAGVKIDAGGPILRLALVEGHPILIDQVEMRITEITINSAKFNFDADPVTRIDRFEIHERKQKGQR